MTYLDHRGKTLPSGWNVFRGEKAFEDHKYIFILSFTILLVRANIAILFVVVKRCNDSCILNKLHNLKIRCSWFLWWDGLRKALLGNLLYFSPYEGKEKIFQRTGFDLSQACKMAFITVDFESSLCSANLL